MTVSELIEALRKLDPSMLVCVNNDVTEEVEPLADSIHTEDDWESPDGETYNIVILTATDWPESFTPEERADIEARFKEAADAALVKLPEDEAGERSG